MHSIYSRINNISGILSTCLMVLLLGISLSSFVFTADPKGSLEISSIQVYVIERFMDFMPNLKEYPTPNSSPGKARRYHNKNQDFAFVQFNVSADLTPLFNWNTKQLFLYVGAEYTDNKGVRNEVVIWDKIVRRKEDADINIQGRNKYAFRELSSTFRKAPPAHYTLKYNVMPYVGILTYGEAARTIEPVAFPESRDLS